MPPDPPLKACIDVESSIIVTCTTPSCNCYTQYSGFEDEFVTCERLADDFDITLANLQAWNTWLGSTDCDADLFDGLAGDADRALCVGTGDSHVDCNLDVHHKQPQHHLNFFDLNFLDSDNVFFSPRNLHNRICLRFRHQHRQP